MKYLIFYLSLVLILSAIVTLIGGFYFLAIRQILLGLFMIILLGPGLFVAGAYVLDRSE